MIYEKRSWVSFPQPIINKTAMYKYNVIYIYNRHRDILQGKKFARKIFKYVYLSFFIITKLFLKSESLQLFRRNYLMVPIEKKPAPGDHESSLKSSWEVPVPYNILNLS